jgi:hypothetical protein
MLTLFRQHAIRQSLHSIAVSERFYDKPVKTGVKFYPCKLACRGICFLESTYSPAATNLRIFSKSPSCSRGKLNRRITSACRPEATSP